MSSVPKKVWVILGVSLAINLFFGGLIAGRLMSHRERPHQQAGFEDDLGPRGFLKRSGLREAGPEVKQILRAQREQLKGNMRSLGQTREHVRVVLETEPYDAEAAAAAFARTREVSVQMQADMHKTLLDVSSKLTPAQRKRMADSLWNHHGKH
jgi:uncharacterized membrane protein